MNKTAIRKFAEWAREKLIEDIKYKAGIVGITENGIAEKLPQSTSDTYFYDVGTKDYTKISGIEIKQRDALVKAIQTKERCYKSYQEAFENVIEEVAYTWFNRLIAIRFMEVNDYLPSGVCVLSSENKAKKEPDLVTTPFDTDLEFTSYEQDRIIQLKDDNKLDELFRMLFIKQCNKLHDILPELFEKTDDYSELLLTISFTDPEGIIHHLINDIEDVDFRINDEMYTDDGKIKADGQVEIIGWLYQYYNTEPKDKVFADLKKNIKISAQAIPAATQLFTPDWIVRYMVENSLGRLWAEGHGKPDDADWKYYLDEAEQEDPVKAELEKIRAEYKNIQPENIKIIDPCMGSGHILVYAFDVLIDIYRSCGWGERDAAKSILRNNLYGLDIDRRAYQLAYFAVMMKARQYNRRICSPENQPNLANFADVMGADTDMLSGSIRRFAEQFAFADTYGSLMTVTAPADIDTAFSDFMPTLGLNMRQFDMMMKIYKILSQKYDVVCTNPPYMGGSGMNAKLSEFVKSKFPDSKSDLFACFIEKCGQLAKPHGFYAMITQHAFMFLSSYENLRKKLMQKTTVNMAHLGARAFDEIGGEVVQTTAFVMTGHIKDYKGTYARLVDTVGENEKRDLFLSGDKRFAAKQENFSKIPGMPVAYWVSEAVNRCFEKGLKFDEFASPKQGIKTADKDRFLRFWHEINYERSSIFDSNIDKWFPCNKGGAFRKWYGNNEYVVNWENDGYEICNFKDENGKMKSRPQNLPYMLKEGLTYTNISSSTFGVRYSPPGFIYDAAGSLIYVENKKMYYALGLLASNIVLVFTRILSPTMSFEVGQIASIPVYYKPNSTIDSLVKENIELSKKDWDSFETSWDFEGHPLV